MYIEWHCLSGKHTYIYAIYMYSPKYLGKLSLLSHEMTVNDEQTRKKLLEFIEDKLKYFSSLYKYIQLASSNIRLTYLWGHLLTCRFCLHSLLLTNNKVLSLLLSLFPHVTMNNESMIICYYDASLLQSLKFWKVKVPIHSCMMLKCNNSNGRCAYNNANGVHCVVQCPLMD